jgi:hypothetical protein
MKVSSARPVLKEVWILTHQQGAAAGHIFSVVGGVSQSSGGIPLMRLPSDSGAAPPSAYIRVNLRFGLQSLIHHLTRTPGNEYPPAKCQKYF